MVKAPRLFWYLLAGFFIINLLQSGFTELFNDEAYYWYYSLDPDWGYFDHPSMVSWLISLGTLIAKSELTVRLGSVVLGCLSVILFWDLVDTPRKDRYIVPFFLILWSMPIWNAFTFLALPDSSQLFSSLLFLSFYKGFLRNERRFWYGLGIAMALMLYSKYHGILIPLLVIGSNPRLVTRRYAWMAVGLGLVLYLPHILWLYDNDWGPIRFHLFERPNGIYDFSGYTLGFVLNLFALFGLLTPLAFQAAYRPIERTRFTRALQWIFWGVTIFFFVSSFNRRVQAQWTVAACLPGALFLFERLLYVSRMRKILLTLLWIQFGLLVYARLALAVPELSPIVFESHYNREWVDELDRKSGGEPVVFENSYVRASKFHFYSGRPSLSLNNFYYRKNEYSSDPIEQELKGQKIHYFSPFLRNPDYKIRYKRKDSIGIQIVDPFVAYRRLRIDWIREGKNPKTEVLQAWLINPYEHTIDLSPMILHTGFCNRAKQMKGSRPNGPLTKFVPAEQIGPGDSLLLELPIPDAQGIQNPSYLRLGISESGLPPGLNSDIYKIR